MTISFTTFLLLLLGKKRTSWLEWRSFWNLCFVHDFVCLWKSCWLLPLTQEKTLSLFYWRSLFSSVSGIESGLGFFSSLLVLLCMIQWPKHYLRKAFVCGFLFVMMEDALCIYKWDICWNGENRGPGKVSYSQEKHEKKQETVFSTS